MKLRKGPERFDSGAPEPEPGPHGGPAATPTAGAAWCLRHLSCTDGGGGATSLTVTVTNNDRCDTEPTHAHSRTSTNLYAPQRTSGMHAFRMQPSRVTLDAWRAGRRGRMHVSGWEFADVGSQQDVRVMLCPGGSIQACALRPRPCAKASCRHMATLYPYTDSHPHVPPHVAPAPPRPARLSTACACVSHEPCGVVGRARAGKTALVDACSGTAGEAAITAG